MKMIFSLWNKHAYLQEVNLEYFIWNNYYLIITETIITQADKTTLLYTCNSNKKGQSSITIRQSYYCILEQYPILKLKSLT